MTRGLFIGCAWLLAAVPGCVAGAPARAPVATVRLVRLADGAIATAPQRFAFHSDEVTVDGTCAYDPVRVEVRFVGTYRTRQPLDPAAMLSYQAYDETGRLLVWDGARFPWTQLGPALREARFDAAIPLPNRMNAARAVTLQFNYVVELQFWYRDRFPQMVLPAFRVEGLPRTTYLDVRWAFIPPVLPADTNCRIPARVEAIYRDDGPVRFLASLDAQGLEHQDRIESARQTLPQLPGGRGEFWQWQELRTTATGMVRLRPGFVLEAVRWDQEFRHNPYHRVLVVGPLVFAVGASLAALGCALAWAAAARIPARGLRWTILAAVAAAALYLAAVLWVAGYLALVGTAGLMLGLARRRLDASTHAYWATLLFCLALELFWGHVDMGFAVTARGTLFSVSVTALALLPVAAVRRSGVATGLLVGLTLLVAVATVAMSVYFDFFADFPSVSALLYAGQAGDLGDSIGTLTGQRQFVPLWLWLAVPLSLLVRRGRARAARAAREFPARPGTPSPAAP